MIVPLQTATIKDEATFAALEPEWWALWRRSPSATPFQSPAWLLPWWEVFQPGQLCVATVREAGRLVGMAPFYIENGPAGRRLLPLGISISDYLDILVDPDCAGAATALSCHMAQAVEGWNEWECTELADGAAAWQLLPCPVGCDEVIERASACSGLSLAGLADLKSVLPKAKQRKLRMAHHRTARRGEPSILPADRSNVAALVDEVARLNGLRRHRRGQDGVFDDGRVSAFHRIAAPRLFAAGLLRLSALLIDARLVAAYYGFHYRGRAYAYLTGFDPDYAFESPGSVLLAHAIDAAIAEGASEIDFLRGDEAYKADWGAALRYNSRRLFRREVHHA